MEKNKRIEKKLKLLKKNGDLYDAISKKKNATPDTFIRKSIKAEVIFYSRILYLFLVLSRRIKNSFISVKKYKNAQDEIREYLGLPVDIIRDKSMFILEKDKKLNISYGNHDPESNLSIRLSFKTLKKNLEHILDFCNTYDINGIYIDEFFLRRYLPKEILDKCIKEYQSDFMCHKASDADAYLYINLNRNGLKIIIDSLEENKYDIGYITSLKEYIKDQVVIDAIDDYVSGNNYHRFFRTIKARLNKHINDESVIKDRVHGKLHQSFELGDTFLKVTVLDNNGNLVNQNIISLYNYLETSDFTTLDKRLGTIMDNQEIDAISLLYLHLLGEKEKEYDDTVQIKSLYDYIYKKYESNHFFKRIPWIKTKLQRIEAEGPQFVMGFWALILTIFFYIVFRNVPKLLPLPDSFMNKYNSFFEGIESAYSKSYEQEGNIIKRIKQTVEKYLPQNIVDEILGYAKDELEIKDNESKKIAEVTMLTEKEVPVYFASEYASSATYFNGKLDFYLRDASVFFQKIVECEPLFQVKMPIDKADFESIYEDSMNDIPLYVYPVGDDYALSKVIIQDENDLDKQIIIDEAWVYYNLWSFTKEEKDMLTSMENPFIYYIYGKREYSSQLRTEGIEYTDVNQQFAKDAILKGLNLESNATDEEINEAIARKEFTKHPIYTPKLDTNELEYYEKIAALDAINLDIASVLTTVANPGSVYMAGYKNGGNLSTISTDEAYVWVMDEDGKIIDFASNFTEENQNTLKESDEWQSNNDTKINNEVPDKTEENKDWESKEEKEQIKETFNKVLEWAKKYHISYITAVFVGVLIINKIFGKKIRFKIKLKKACNILNDDDLAITYTDLMNFMYGIECAPIKRGVPEMVELIYKEFYALSDEDIEALLIDIKNTMKENKDKSLKDAESLLKEIPFIRDNRNEILLQEAKKLLLNKKRTH